MGELNIVYSRIPVTTFGTEKIRKLSESGRDNGKAPTKAVDANRSPDRKTENKTENTNNIRVQSYYFWPWEKVTFPQVQINL